MSTKNVTTCDQCGTEQPIPYARTYAEEPWLEVRQGDGDLLDFCSSACAVKRLGGSTTTVVTEPGPGLDQCTAELGCPASEHTVGCPTAPADFIRSQIGSFQRADDPAGIFDSAPGRYRRGRGIGFQMGSGQ